MGTGSAFGFIDPDQVIHACYLIPRFSDGKSQPVSLDGKGA